MIQSQLNYIQSSADESCKIAVRSCLPETEAKAIMVILHGATLPSIIFDLPVCEGNSMLSYMAENGIAAYTLDYRGYGLSSKPLAMDDPLMGGKPLINHVDATVDVLDVLDVLKFINQRHGKKEVIFCGFSWGSTIAGHIAATTNLATKLILLGPVYSHQNPQWAELADPNNVTKLNPSIKSYRIVSRERWCGLWDRELKTHNALKWRDLAVLENLLVNIENSDSAWASQNARSACIRIPTGVLSDALRVYNKNPIYDASKITCPTLVIRGEQDSASVSIDVSGLFNSLTCPKERMDITNATHYGILEKESRRFFKAISKFAVSLT
ncbi:MAG: alpha/beta hydrolase [Alphaproteobacteria bacterium]